MGDCKYCGKSAGFLRKQHQECADKNDAAHGAIKDLCVQAALYGGDLDSLTDKIRDKATQGFVTTSKRRLRKMIADGWCHAVMAAAEDKVLSADEKAGLNRYRNRFGLTVTQLDRLDHFTLFRKMAVLGSIIEQNRIPRLDRKAIRQQFGMMPFNLMKSEALVWLFPDVGYVEQVTHRHYEGGSMGLSVRVARGVYVRPGAFKGRQVSSTSMELTDSGVLGITTKHIYFRGSAKTFRVRLEKIVAFDPYQEGLGITREAARPKPEVFTMDSTDLWFSVNLIEALMDMDDLRLPKQDSPTLEEIIDGSGNDDDAGLFIAGSSMSS